MGTRRFGRYTVETSNEEKLLFPGDGITKGDVLDYYDGAAEGLLRSLERRPLAVERYPDGIEREGFHQKQVAASAPAWIDRVRVSKRDGGFQELPVCGNRATLAYLGNQACLELHPWLSRRDRPERPDQLVFDLDPPDAGFAPVRVAARRVRRLLEELGLPVFAKLSGSRGLHVVVPLDRSEAFDDVRAFARDAASLLARRHADELTTEQRIAKRRGRLYLDVGRNAWAQTAVAAWSLRARPGAPVAMPIRWDELRDARLDARAFDRGRALRRLASDGDPWRGMMRRACSLSRARELLSRLREQAPARDGCP